MEIDFVFAASRYNDKVVKTQLYTHKVRNSGKKINYLFTEINVICISLKLKKRKILSNLLWFSRITLDTKFPNQTQKIAMLQWNQIRLGCHTISKTQFDIRLKYKYTRVSWADNNIGLVSVSWIVHFNYLISQFTSNAKILLEKKIFKFEIFFK